MMGHFPEREKKEEKRKKKKKRKRKKKSPVFRPNNSETK